MTLEPPQPPTAPAPAIRPTPPKPPRIDKTPFAKSSADETLEESSDAPQLNREVTTPEDMARDAVAHGSGALTKRTVERGNDEQNPPPNQTVTIIPPDAPLISDTQSDYDKGKDVLREFRDMDARQNQPQENFPTHSSTEQPKPTVPKLNYHEEHGGGYWIFTIVFAAIAAFVIVKKFLLTDKPALTKSQLFDDSTDRLKAAADKVKPVKLPPKPVAKPVSKPAVKPVAKPARQAKDDDKGKHFEIRV